MTRQEIRNAVIARTRRTDKTAEINEAINQALTEIQQVRDFRSTKVEETGSLLQGGQTFTITGDMFQLLHVFLQDPTTLVNAIEIPLLDKSLVTMKYPDKGSNVEGWPGVCYVEGQVVTFVPISSQEWNVRVEYFQLVPELSTDAGIVSRQLAAAVVCWCTSEIFKLTQQWQDADKWMAEYGRRLQLAISADGRSREITVMAPFRQNESYQSSSLPPYLDPFYGLDV